MADQSAAAAVSAAVSVICHGQPAGRALGHIAALSAGHEGGIPSPVEEQHDLPALFELPVHLCRQSAADDSPVACFHFLPHIDDFRLRKADLVVSLRQFDQLVDALLRPAVGNDGRRGAAENQNAAAVTVLQTFDCHLYSVVFGRKVGLVRRLVLLIHHDQTQSIHRCKSRRSGSDDDSCFAVSDFLPLVVAFPCR